MRAALGFVAKLFVFAGKSLFPCGMSGGGFGWVHLYAEEGGSLGMSIFIIEEVSEFMDDNGEANLGLMLEYTC